MAINRTDLQQLTDLRVTEARALLAAGHAAGAYYLLGYAIECAFKARIAKQVREHDFPDKNLGARSYTHNLADLLKLSGLQPAYDEDIKTNPQLAVNWSVAKDWSEEVRYKQSVPQIVVTDFFDAVLDRSNGVLTWIRGRW